MRYSIALAISTFGTAFVALGHHSDAALEMDRIMTIEGSITEYSMRNPHTYFVVAVTNELGETEEWNVQMASAITVRRRGWTRDTLQIGDEVVVGLRPASDGRPYGLLSTIEREGVPVSYSFEREAGFPVQQATTNTIAGIWMTDRSRLPADYPGGLDQLMAARLTLTEKGRMMNEAYSQNDADNPELACMTKPTPGAIVYSRLYPLQIDVLEDQQIIMIRSQFFDQERTVYMDGREHPPARERTHEGHSIGWWEGDVLVVDTTNFADNRSPYQNGTPSGAQKHVVERYELLDGGTHLSVEFTLEDPEFIVGSMTDRRDLVYSPHIEFAPFNCDREATRRYLPESGD